MAMRKRWDGEIAVVDITYDIPGPGKEPRPFFCESEIVFRGAYVLPGTEAAAYNYVPRNVWYR
jgi:hypothetical protein